MSRNRQRRNGCPAARRCRSRRSPPSPTGDTGNRRPKPWRCRPARHRRPGRAGRSSRPARRSAARRAPRSALPARCPRRRRCRRRARRGASPRSGRTRPRGPCSDADSARSAARRSPPATPAVYRRHQAQVATRRPGPGGDRSPEVRTTPSAAATANENLSAADVSSEPMTAPEDAMSSTIEAPDVDATSSAQPSPIEFHRPSS